MKKILYILLTLTISLPSYGETIVTLDNGINIYLSVNTIYSRDMQLALEAVMDKALKDLVKNRGEKLGLTDAWTMYVNKEDLAYISVRMDFKTSSNADETVEAVAMRLRDALHTPLSKKTYDLVADSFMKSSDVQGSFKPIQSDAYSDFNALLSKTYDALEVHYPVVKKLTHANVATHLKNILSPVWYSWESENGLKDRAEKLVDTFMASFTKSPKEFTVTIPPKEKEVSLDSVLKNKRIPIVKETKIDDKVWLWTLPNDIKVYFYQGKGKTDISGYKENRTGYSAGTLNPVFAQVAEKPVQGKTTEEMNKFYNSKMGSLAIFPQQHYIKISGFSHGMDDKDMFALLHARLTEKTLLKKTILEVPNLKGKEKFNAELMEAQNNIEVYKDTTLTSVQATKVYKDYIQNADGYSFVITSSTDRAEKIL